MQALVGLSNICQVCIVVKDLEASMERYRLIMGIGPFNIYTVDTSQMSGVLYHGGPADYVARVGIAQVGGWEFELAQHVSGESIYKDFLDNYGEGLQHLGVVVGADEYDSAFAEFVAQGYQPVMGGPIPGLNRDGRFDYFEASSGLGSIIELLDIPEERAPAGETYPPSV